MFQGDVVLVRFPFSNLTDYKIRPAVVVSNNEFNSKFDLWLCPITSTPVSDSDSLKNYLEEGKLDKNSYAKTSVLFSVASDLILKQIGKLSVNKTREIVDALKSNF